MSNKPKTDEKEPVRLEEIPANSNVTLVEKADVEISPDEFDDILPQMNVSVPQPQAQDAAQLISDDQYLGVLDEIMNNIREDRKQVSDYIDNFADMVINDGDATTSTKETLVGLVNIKAGLQDKMLKAADLMTRLKLKNAYAHSGPHLNALQQNNFNIGSDATDFSRKELIRAINTAKKKKD